MIPKKRFKLLDTIDGGDVSFFTEDENGIFVNYVNMYYDGDTDTYSADYPIPWLTRGLASEFDRLYYLHHSGEKLVSRMYERLIERINETEVPPIEITNNGVKQVLMQMVVTQYGDKWNRLYDAFIDEQYAPLENYNMEQKETPDITKTTTREQDVTEERKVASDITTGTTNDITDVDTYGFNSSGAVPSGKSTRNASVTVSGDADDNVDTLHITGDADNNITTESESGTRTITRNGNIGVTTSQQMLQSEIDLRNNFNFTEQVFDDMDTILCLLVY